MVRCGTIRSISVVRTNQNGYPFVTVISGDGRVQNLYFGKRTSERVAAGQQFTLDELKQLEIGFTNNASGEERIKLSFPGEPNGEYTDLGAMLGLEAVQTCSDAEMTAALEPLWKVAERQVAVGER